MSNSIFSTSTPTISDDSLAWDGLQRAILASSGFQRWCVETGQPLDANTDPSKEQLVIDYLRETLETLAY